MFPGTFGQLDLRARAIPVEMADVGRMRWACDILDQGCDVKSRLTGIAVRCDLMKDQFSDDNGSKHFLNLQSIEHDAEIDAVTLSLYWNRDQRK